MSCPLAGNVAPGIKLVPIIVQSTLKTVKSGCHHYVFGEFVPCVYDSNTKIISPYIKSKSSFINL